MTPHEREVMQNAWVALCNLSERKDVLKTVEEREALRACLAQPEPEPEIEVMAEAVHNAYLTTCDSLGWGVKPENRVPYAELTEDSKELDRASVRAVLNFQKREWVGLTVEERNELVQRADALLDHIYEYTTISEGITPRIKSLFKAVEAKLKEKNV